MVITCSSTRVPPFFTSCMRCGFLLMRASFVMFWQKMYAKRKEIMFIGDLNMNMLKSSDNPNGPNKDLTKFIEQFCLTNVIHEATRTTNYSKTLLDVVLTSHPERLAKSGTLQVGISDHDLIFDLCCQETKDTET